MEKLYLDDDGLVKYRESERLEFKENFHKRQKEYIKTICAFANNQGGEIIFGVKDSSREPIGISGKKRIKFIRYDSKDLTTQIQNNLSEKIDFVFSYFSQEINGKKITFGVLKIEEAKYKPIVCETTDGKRKLRKGAIYYRYNGKSEEIKEADLIRLNQEKINFQNLTPEMIYAKSMLFNRWDGNKQGDKELIADYFNTSYENFIVEIKKNSHSEKSDFKYINGKWELSYTENSWVRLAEFLYSEDLDRFHKLSVKILSEKHPMFDLEPEEYFYAPVYGKFLKYSNELRNGISETLAFLGVQGKELQRCSLPKRQDTAILIIRDIFKDADWKLWASLNDVIPTLAEAAPNEFLSSIENVLEQNPCPFDEIYNQQRNSFTTNRNYMAGIYWALERLAWKADYLTRIILILANLATHDTVKSNWGSHPSNSIIIILLPWFPQTTASITQRISALKGIQRNHPEIAWNILLNLLPNHLQNSSYSDRPKYRKFIPNTWKNEALISEYQAQVEECAFMVIEMAKGNTEYISTLIKKLNILPQSAFDLFLKYLSSEDVTKLTDENKQSIWENMNTFIKEHRRYTSAKWALPVEKVNSIEEVASMLAPLNPEILYRHLFSNRDFDLIEGDDWEANLQSQQVESLKKIYAIKQNSSIINFSKNIEDPSKVGFAFAEIASDEDENKLLPSCLDDQKQFIGGYIQSRFHKRGFKWLNGLDNSKWSLDQKCELLLNCPFENKIWQKADELLGKDVGRYWEKTSTHSYSSQSNLTPAIKKLLKYNRPILAINCIFADLYKEHTLPPKELIIEALVNAVTSEEHLNLMNPSYMPKLIKKLQDDPRINDDDLFNIEWAYLSFLDRYSDAKPKLLEKYLSQKPKYFIEVIQLVYGSKNENKDEQNLDDSRARKVKNAEKLLFYWKHPPGKMDDGTFSSDALNEWYEEVKEKTIESGYFEVAMEHFGKVLFYAGADSNSLWIKESVAELLDKKDNSDIREGFTAEIVNSRGIYNVDPSGNAEKELAKKWRSKAEQVEEKGFIHFTTVLRQQADLYDLYAERTIAKYKAQFPNDDGDTAE